MPQDMLSLAPDGANIQQVVKWLANGYHIAIFEHRRLAATAFIMWGIYPKLPFQIIKFILVGIVRCLGFGEGGVEKGSFASRYQSKNYGGSVKSDTLFSRSQSVGARRNKETDSEGGPGFLGFVLFLAAFLTWAGYMPDSL